MLNQKIILIFNNQKSRILNIFMRISQDFSLFLILFLFYNAELLEICNSIKVEVNNLAFVNNVNIFIYKLICNICRNSILDSDHVTHMIRSSVVTSLRFTINILISILISITSINQSSVSASYIIVD